VWGAHDTSNGFDSGYYTEASDIRPPTGGGNYNFDCSTCVIYIACDETDTISFPNNSYMRLRALIVTCDLDFNADGEDGFSATIPDDAADEYQYTTLQTPNYFSVTKSWTEGGTATIDDLGFHGFMYVSGEMSNSGGGSIVIGSIFVGDDVTMNSLTLYYDEVVANDVELTGATVSRVSWDEVVTTW